MDDIYQIIDEWHIIIINQRCFSYCPLVFLVMHECHSSNNEICLLSDPW